MKDLEKNYRITLENSGERYLRDVDADQDVEWNLLILRKFKSNEALVYANNLNESSMSAWIKAISLA